MAAILMVLAFGNGGITEAAEPAAGTSANPFADLGLPEVSVTITNEAFEGVPAGLPAGRYVLSVTNMYHESTEATEGAGLLRLPEGISSAEFVASVHNEELAWPPDWYYETPLAGGPYAPLGATAHAVIDLTAGDWILWSEAPGSPQAPVQITVTGELPADAPTPMANVTVELSDFDFTFDSPLVAGQQTIEVVNTGDQPHFIFIGGVPAGTTVAEAQAAFDEYWDPESAPSAPFSFAETPEYLGAGDQSAGSTAWYAVDLPRGTVVIACFVTDPETGLPHDKLGMTEIMVID